jgi:hypothetical protein
MASGRLLFGVGAETFQIATLAAVTVFYPRRHTALMMGLTIGVGRAGSWIADLSPTIWKGAYASGWQRPLLLASGIAATSFVASAAYWLVETRSARREDVPQRQAQPFAWRDVLGFGSA